MFLGSPVVDERFQETVVELKMMIIDVLHVVNTFFSRLRCRVAQIHFFVVFIWKEADDSSETFLPPLKNPTTGTKMSRPYTHDAETRVMHSRTLNRRLFTPCQH